VTGAGGQAMEERKARAPGATPLRIGLMAAALILALDQATKLGLIYLTDLRLTYPWPILPFLDLTVVWNYGISYGLFPQEGPAGRWILASIKLGASLILFYWLRRVSSRVEALGIGLVMAGAFGNAIDRIWHGAVFDFVHFHIGTFSWYVFNIADAAIVAGVGFMVLSGFLPAGGPRASVGNAGEKP
jgi:signal peptidase II